MHRLCTNATVKRTFKLFNRSSMVGKSHQLLTTSCFFVTTLGFSLVAQKNYKKNCKLSNTFFAPSMFAIFATSPTQILLSSKTILLSLSFSVPCCTDRNFTRQKCVVFCDVKIIARFDEEHDKDSRYCQQYLPHLLVLNCTLLSLWRRGKNMAEKI